MKFASDRDYYSAIVQEIENQSLGNEARAVELRRDFALERCMSRFDSREVAVKGGFGVRTVLEQGAERPRDLVHGALLLKEGKFDEWLPAIGTLRCLTNAMPSASFFQTYNVCWVSFCLVAAWQLPFLCRSAHG